MLGESRREFPQSYLETHVVANGGNLPMETALERVVRFLLTAGYIEARTRTTNIPEERGTGFFDCPAHVLTATTYHATDAGRAAWTNGNL
jgi:hypothetical protein